MIRVFVTDVSRLTPEAAERLYVSLPQWRQDKLGHIHVTNQKMLSAGAGFILAAAFNSFGLDAHTTRVSTTKQGKPYLPDIPGIHFSLSHSGSMAMCAIADSPVGCDIQELSSVRHSERIAQRFFTSAEYARITTAADRTREFVRLWTLKESYVKYLGTGIAGCPLDSFELVGEPPAPAQTSSEPPPIFHEYTFGENLVLRLSPHLAAVCCRQSPCEAAYIDIAV